MVYIAAYLAFGVLIGLLFKREFQYTAATEKRFEVEVQKFRFKGMDWPVVVVVLITVTWPLILLLWLVVKFRS